MPLCDACDNPCLLLKAGKHSTARAGSLGRYVQPGPSVLSEMLQYVRDNPSERFKRDFETTPLCDSDLFCVDKGCLYALVIERRKRGSHQVGKDENERKRKAEHKQNCVLSGVSPSSFYSRNKYDRFKTSPDQLDQLLSFITPSGVVADICGGQLDAIYKHFSRQLPNSTPVADMVGTARAAGGGEAVAGTTCVTNDLNHLVKSHYHMDASSSDFANTWKETVAAEHGLVDWVITSPPYGSNAAKCVASAMRLARRGVAMKLRITFLEPCNDRAQLLRDYPVDLLVSMKRDGSRGKSNDTVCEGWFVWYITDAHTNAPHGIRVV
jgi:hypothetical protein